MSIMSTGTLVDLSQPIYEGMPVYPGHLATAIWTHTTHEETAERFVGGFSFQSMGVTLCDHGPTHVDALSHLDPDPRAASIDQMGLDLFWGPGTCLDVSEVAASRDVTANDLQRAADEISVDVRPGDVLLLCTGTHARHGDTSRYTAAYTGFDTTAAEWLRSSGIKIFGVDSPSPDSPSSPDYPVHMMCRASGITHYENLAGLERVIGRRFQFFGLPLYIRGGTGSPVRAVAILDGQEATGR